jgi:hypothetical protein
MHIKDVHEYGCEEAEKVASDYLDDTRKKQVKSAVESIVEDEFYRLEDRAAEFLEATAAQRCEQFLERVLQGDENAAGELIGAKRHRYRSMGYDEGKPWASVIHGKIFETDIMTIRRKIVEAHPDLLRNERIADLESIVEGLRAQIIKLEADNERLLRR